MKLMVRKILQKGAALVEFAILLPVFILLVMGTLELGWALYIQNTIVDASRLGARLATTDSSATLASVSAEITDYLENSNVSTIGAEIDISPATFTSQARGTPIMVTVSITYNSISILPTPIFLGNKALQAQATMAKEY